MEKALRLFKGAEKLYAEKLQSGEKRFTFQYGDKVLVLDIDLTVLDTGFYSIEKITLPKLVVSEDTKYLTMLVQKEVSTCNDWLREDFVNSRQENWNNVKFYEG